MGTISTSRCKKPGEDDSFSAWIAVGAAKTGDTYLDQAMPRFSENTYSDYGFYSCYAMEDDYNREQRPSDEARLPLLVAEVKEKFRATYSPEAHHQHLVDEYARQLRQQVYTTLYNAGRVDVNDLISTAWP